MGNAAVLMQIYKAEWRQARKSDENKHWRWADASRKSLLRWVPNELLPQPRRVTACAYCGKEFSNLASIIRDRTWCSPQCGRLGRLQRSGTPIKCSKCGGDIERPRRPWKNLCRKCNPLPAKDPASVAHRRFNNRLADNLRSRIGHVLKGNQKSSRTLKLLGCSVEQLRSHLESQFRRGMTWGNWGALWHIDHREPCAAFDLSDPRQQMRCFHFSNLQPLKIKDNLCKNAKIVPTQRELLISLS